jgi:hypothetical protein
MKHLLAIVCLFFALEACKKKNKNSESVSNHPVPAVPVAMTIYPNDPLNFKLQSIGGWQYFDGGVRGIVVYRKSEEEFVALDRTSTAQPDNVAAVAIVQQDNFTLKDTVSGSTWRIIDGTVTKGPAEWALRVYATSYSNNTLRIVN